MRLLAVLAMVGGVAFMLFKQTVQSQLQKQISNKVSEVLQGTDLTFNLEQARFHEGRGLQLNYVSLNLASGAPSQPHSHLEIYEAFIHAPISMAQLIASDLPIEKIDITRAKITLVRDQNGEWDFSNIIDSLPKTDSENPIQIEFRDCEIRMVDEQNVNNPPITLTNVNFRLGPRLNGGNKYQQFDGAFESKAISKIAFQGFLHPPTKQWKAKLSATNAQLSSGLIKLLPADMQDQMKELRAVSGKINLKVEAQGLATLEEIPEIQIDAQVEQLTIDDNRLPFPIQNGSFEFQSSIGHDNEFLSIKNATARFGEAQFKCDYWHRGFVLAPEQYKLNGRLDNFNFSNQERLIKWFPEYCTKFCNEYSPSGTSDIGFELEYDGDSLNRSVNADLTDMSFSFIKLPYEISNCRGKVTLNNEKCDFYVQSNSGDDLITLKGSARGVGKSPTYEVNISAPGALPIDQKMRDAINAHPEMASVINRFGIQGQVSGTGRVFKNSPNGDVNREFDVRLKNCSIRHDNFDYPINEIDGLIQIQNNDYRFRNLTGKNHQGRVNCDGYWNPNEGLDVTFLCESIPLDDTLKYSLSSELREIWDSLRIRGTLDQLKVDMTMPPGAPGVDLAMTARMGARNIRPNPNQISILPVWFPYEVNDLTGQVNVKDGKVKLTNIQGNHGRTKLSCEGSGAYTNNDWFISIDQMEVSSLKVDGDLIDAVPKEIAPAIRQLEFEGIIGVSGALKVESAGRQPIQNQPGQPTILGNGPLQAKLSWSDVRFDFSGARMMIGMPVENIYGFVTVSGISDQVSSRCSGKINLDTISIYGHQVTEITGPIWLDDQVILAGNKNNIRLGAENSPVRYPPIKGRMHKGEVVFNAEMETAGMNRYRLDAELTNGCLKESCKEFGTDAQNITGTSRAQIELEGDYEGIQSQAGRGAIQIYDAKIYELPIFLRLLTILNLQDDHAFDTANISFDVQGDEINFDQMKFTGNAISLSGEGNMNLDQDLDFKFHSVFGRDRYDIPLLSKLYHKSSERILQIEVKGTVENPKTKQRWLSQLGEAGPLGQGRKP
ncbi:MAG: AsmA-like C-terminal region-containing protein [Mariniblastus sp.]|nr:AsmA-like C-terminal region-containing protein [Mariniblastus sp.]